MTHEMDIDKLCDDVLFAVYQNNDGHYASANVISLQLKQYSQKSIAVAMQIITSNGFASHQGSSDAISIKLSLTGIAFLHTDTFVDRSKRWDLDQKKNKLELEKVEFEVSKLKSTYRLAIWGFAVAALTFILDQADVKLSRLLEWIQLPLQ